MNTSLDEDLIQRVNDLGTIPWSGTTYRYTTPRRDALSGTGARLNGGRWNPRDAFATIYLAHPLAACIAELERAAELTNVSVSDAVRSGRTLHTIEVHDVQMLDLSSEQNQAAIGLGTGDIADAITPPARLSARPPTSWATKVSWRPRPPSSAWCWRSSRLACGTSSCRSLPPNR